MQHNYFRLEEKDSIKLSVQPNYWCTTQWIGCCKIYLTQPPWSSYRQLGGTQIWILLSNILIKIFQSFPRFHHGNEYLDGTSTDTPSANIHISSKVITERHYFTDKTFLVDSFCRVHDRRLMFFFRSQGCVTGEPIICLLMLRYKVCSLFLLT